MGHKCIHHDYALQLIKKVFGTNSIQHTLGGWLSGWLLFLWFDNTQKKQKRIHKPFHTEAVVLQNANRNKSKQVRNMHNAEVSVVCSMRSGLKCWHNSQQREKCHRKCIVVR